MKVQPLITMHIDLSAPIDIGECPNGMRTILNVIGGTFEGVRIKGKVLPGGADWMLISSDRVGRLDVRIALEANDGACIGVQYSGVLVMNDKVMNALQNRGTTEYGETYFMTQLRFETGDARYAWLNRTVAVGEGRIRPSAVEYRVFELIND